MARLPRLTAAGEAHHLVQRGLGDRPVFADDADRRYFLELLRDDARQSEVAVHGYVLLETQVQLLATPRRAGGVGRLMQAISRRYVPSCHRRHGFHGPLWETRHRSTLVQGGSHLLDCLVHLDLAPIRAGLVARAIDWPWSSLGHYIGARVDPMLTPPDCVWALGNTPFAREHAYAERVAAGLDARTGTRHEEAVLKGWAIGDPDWLALIATSTGRRTVRGRAGRPRTANPS